MFAAPCRFAARYFGDAPPVFQRLFFTSAESSSVQYGPRRMKLRDLMGATLRFLRSDCAKYRELWDWSACVSQLLTSDVLVRWCVPSSFMVVFLFGGLFGFRIFYSRLFPFLLLVLVIFQTLVLFPFRYTAHCLALVSHMTDNQKTIFLRKVLSSEEILHLKLKYVARVCRCSS